MERSNRINKRKAVYIDYFIIKLEKGHKEKILRSSRKFMLYSEKTVTIIADFLLKTKEDRRKLKDSFKGLKGKTSVNSEIYI